MTDKPELTVERGYYIEVNVGSWEKQEGKDARHHKGGGIYRGGVTQDEAQRLLALVAYPEEPRALSGGVGEQFLSECVQMLEYGRCTSSDKQACETYERLRDQAKAMLASAPGGPKEGA